MTLSKEKIAEYEKTTGHSIYGPSGMARIMRCPASVSEALRAPLQRTSSYASHGTKLHDIIAKATLDPSKDSYTIVKRNLSIEQDDKVLLFDSLDYYYDEFMKFPSDTIAPHVMTEQSVSLAKWGLPEVYGTADKTGVTRELIKVLDWKFGSGEQIYSENNEQLMTYAAGAIAELDALDLPSSFPVEIHVVQPALNHFDKWETTFGYLRDWVVDELTPAIRATQEVNPPYVPGYKQCLFCPAKATCHARHKAQLKTAEGVFENYALIEKTPPMVTHAQIAEFLKRVPELEKFIKDLRKYAQAAIMAGQEIPGFKIIRGKSNRKFKNDAQAAKWLRQYASMTNDQLYELKFVSPAKAEKANRSLKKDPDFASLIENPPGTLQLVLDSDPRPAVVFNDPASAFAGYIEDDNGKEEDGE